MRGGPGVFPECLNKGLDLSVGQVSGFGKKRGVSFICLFTESSGPVNISSQRFHTISGRHHARKIKMGSSNLSNHFFSCFVVGCTVEKEVHYRL